LCVKVVHEERLREGSLACVQFAILYSSASGQRRVRVHSMALPVTRSLGSVFRGADLEVYMAYLARKVSMSMPGKSLSFVRDIINKSVIGTLLAYRKHVRVWVLSCVENFGFDGAFFTCAVCLFIIFWSVDTPRITKADAIILPWSHEASMLQNRCEGRCKGGMDG